MSQARAVSAVLEALLRGEWSAEAAWWLGVVYGDGHVAKSGFSITVVSADEDLLLKWGAVGGLSAESVKPRKGSRAKTITLFSTRLCSWFEGRGIKGEKSGTLPWPEDLPLEYLSHFVRGLWDTDGSVLHTKRERDKRFDILRLSLTLKARAFVERLHSVLPVPTVVCDQRCSNPVYADRVYRQIRASGRPGEALWAWVYGDAPESLRCERKYKVGLEYIAWARTQTHACDRCGVELRGSVRCDTCRRVKWEGALCACGSKVYAKGACYNCYARSRYRARKGWEDETVLAWLTDYPVAAWKALPQEQQAAQLDEVFQVYRQRDFPWSVVSQGVEADVLERVRRSVVRVEGDTILSVGWSGQRTCAALYLHRLECAYRGQLSVVAAYGRDAALRKAIKYQLSHGQAVTPRRVLRALSALNKGPTNYAPSLTRWIVDQYVCEGGVVFDPCSGYGGRLLGALAAERRVSYIGHDPEPKTVASALRLAEHVGQSARVQMVQAAVEDAVPWPEADLLFTSPPYFGRESYGRVSDSLVAQYSGFDTGARPWTEGFLRPLLVRGLASSKIVALSTSTFRDGEKRADLPGAVVRLFRESGAQILRQLRWEAPSFGWPHIEHIVIATRG